MKKTLIQKLKLGIFVITGMIFFVIGVYLIGQKKNMFSNTASITSVFQNVNGLMEGNNVRYSGINVGTVVNIEMVNDSMIMVKMIIEEDIMPHINKNAVATIGADGLVGNMIVNIVPGIGDSPMLKDGDSIVSYSKIGADDILTTLSTTNENAAILTSDLLKITNTILEGKGTLGVLLNDTIMAQDLVNSMANLKKISRGASQSINELNDMMASFKTNNKSVAGLLLNDTVSGDKIKTMIINLESSSSEIEKVVGNMNTVLEDIQSGQGTINYLSEDTLIVNDLKATMKNLNEGTDRFNQNMEALKHNFLFKKYFKKLEKEKKKEKKANQP